MTRCRSPRVSSECGYTSLDRKTNAPAICAAVLTRLDTKHYVTVCQDCRYWIDYYCKVSLDADAENGKEDGPPPDNAFPSKTTSGRTLSYSDANNLPVRQRPWHDPRSARRFPDVISTPNERGKNTNSLNFITDEEDVVFSA